MRFAFIKGYDGIMLRERLCSFFGVTSRGLRAHVQSEECRRRQVDRALLLHIQEQHRLSLGTYGRARMTEELKEQGFVVGERRVGRLMAINGIRVDRRRKYRTTTNSDHAYAVAPNVLERDFTPQETNRSWAADITYIRTCEGWLYLAVVIDLFSRRIIGWAVSNRLKRDLAVRAL